MIIVTSFSRIDSSVQRLRAELSLLSQCRIISCKRCDTQLADQSDIFSMSKEGPSGAFINPGGHLHETLTLYKEIGHYLPTIYILNYTLQGNWAIFTYNLRTKLHFTWKLTIFTYNLHTKLHLTRKLGNIYLQTTYLITLYKEINNIYLQST